MSPPPLLQPAFHGAAPTTTDRLTTLSPTAWAEAEEIAADRLEAEAWRRAVDGVSEPVIQHGKTGPR
jgi:hypothetical protein